jgi:hypothetical protein
VSALIALNTDEVPTLNQFIYLLFNVMLREREGPRQKDKENLK